jgi:hypothetical protein
LLVIALVGHPRGRLGREDPARLPAEPVIGHLRPEPAGVGEAQLLAAGASQGENELLSRIIPDRVTVWHTK